MGYRHGDVEPIMAERAGKLRKNMTPEEKKLWHEFLKHLSYTFNRQYVFDTYIVDFYCEEKKLVIEIDGSQHYEEGNIRKDAMRTAFLETFGCRVIRFTNREIHEEFEAVCTQIQNVLENIRG